MALKTEINALLQAVSSQVCPDPAPLVRTLVAEVNDLKQTVSTPSCPDPSPLLLAGLSELNASLELNYNMLRMAVSAGQSNVLHLLQETVLSPAPHQLDIQQLMLDCVGNSSNLVAGVEKFSRLVKELSLPCPDTVVTSQICPDWTEPGNVEYNQSCNFYQVAGVNFTVCWASESQPSQLNLYLYYVKLLFTTDFLAPGEKNN